jgi:monoamine oxidase
MEALASPPAATTEPVAAHLVPSNQHTRCTSDPPCLQSALGFHPPEGGGPSAGGADRIRHASASGTGLRMIARPPPGDAHTRAALCQYRHRDRAGMHGASSARAGSRVGTGMPQGCDMDMHDKRARQGQQEGVMSTGDAPLTRRRFLEMVGAAGGAAAVYESMVVLGMLATPEAYAGPPDTSGAPGNGKRVIVLGAGVAGLTAAYRLKQAGFDVAVYEAARYIGGRNFTVSKDPDKNRNVIVERSSSGVETRQVCDFDGDPATQYFEAGAGRIPYHHIALLELCRELGVALEPYVMETTANRFQTEGAFDGEPVENRRIANDTRGYIASLLAKAIDRKALDDLLTADERRKLLSLLTQFGEVRADSKPPYEYFGSTRSGYLVDPGVTEPGQRPDPLALSALLDSEFWKHRFYQPQDYLWQATLFHPTGGMQAIVDALADAFGRKQIHTGQVAARIRNLRNGVEVEFANGTRILADYCFSTVPLPLLGRMLGDGFSADFRKAVSKAKFAPTCKVGWQAKARFWERLSDGGLRNGPQIFGGISWIDHPITQMWYPSSGYFSKGPAILTGAYNYDAPGRPVATRFGNLSLNERLTVAVQGAKRLHPEFADYVEIRKGLSIAWQHVPHIGGGWAEWDPNDKEQGIAYRRLLSPDGRFHVGGDQVSYLPGWQEGAVLSAYHGVEWIIGRKAMLQAIPGDLPAPDSGSSTGAY